ncbi:MAG: acyl carrier protein [Treponema sp.]|nr:acyl carrier protein [Treponema sp.]
MKDKVISIVSKAVKLDAAVLSQNPSEQLWDSLTHLEIIFLLEEAFDIQLDVADITYMRSIDAIMEVLSRVSGDKK